jgi:hypothetical protein
MPPRRSSPAPWPWPLAAVPRRRTTRSCPSGGQPGPRPRTSRTFSRTRSRWRRTSNPQSWRQAFGSVPSASSSSVPGPPTGSAGGRSRSAEAPPARLGLSRSQRLVPDGGSGGRRRRRGRDGAAGAHRLRGRHWRLGLGEFHRGGVRRDRRGPHRWLTLHRTTRSCSTATTRSSPTVSSDGGWSATTGWCSAASPVSSYCGGGTCR